MRFKTIWLFLLIGSYLLMSPIVEADFIENDLSLETSIVMLVISDGEKEIRTDPFFEILILEEEGYFLLPLTLLNPYFDMNINLKRNEGNIIIINTVNEEEVLIDLENRVYPDNPEWNGKGPLVFADDFFVCVELISELFNIDIEWNSAYQELLLTGEYFSEDQNTNDKKNISDYEEKGNNQDIEVDKIVSSDDFSIGSIHYRYKIDYRNDSDSLADRFQNQGSFSLFGNYHDWILSLGSIVDYDSSQKKYDISFPMIKIKYRVEDHFLQIGDSDFNFNQTKGDNKLRGINYSYPCFPKSEVLSFTSVSGTADIGDKVLLVVNGRVFKEIKLQKKDYIFEKVPLDNYRLNQLKIIVKKTDGSEESIVKEIAASPLINYEGTLESEVVSGLYRNKSLEEWEGYIAGFSLNYTPLKDTTTRIETVAYKEKSTNTLCQGTSVGITTLWGEKTVASLDLFSSSKDFIVNFGGRGEIKYFFPQGIINGSYIYLPVDAAYAVQYDQGETLRLNGRLGIKPGLYVNSGLRAYKTLAKDELFKSSKGNIALTYDQGWQFSNTLGVSGEKINAFFSLPDDEIYYKGENIRWGFNYLINYFAPGFKGKGEINLYNNNISLDNSFDWDFQEGKIKIDFYKKLGPSFLIDNDFNVSGRRFKNSFYSVDQERKTKLGFVANKKLSLFMQNSLKDLETDGTRWEENILKLENTWDKNKLIGLQVGAVDSNTDLDYYFGGISGQYYSLESPEVITIFCDYIKPKLEDIKGHLTYGMGYKKTIWGDKELEISLGKDYYSLLNDNSEYYLSISISTAVGFAGNNIVSQDYNGKKHTSFVTGVIYLDENRNKKYDKGEEKLSGIKMRLDNITADSGNEGGYMINVNFPGIYEIGFDLNKLPADYTPVTTSQKVNIEENKNIYLDFGLTINGSISGKVFQDLNANGVIDKSDKPLQWVGVSLNSGDRVSYTDSRGDFYFENVPLGSHTLTISSDSLPTGVVSSHDLPLKVFIDKENVDVSNILLPLIYKFE